MRQTSGETLLTTQEAAERLGCAVTTIHTRTHRGQLQPAIRGVHGRGPGSGGQQPSYYRLEDIDALWPIRQATRVRAPVPEIVTGHTCPACGAGVALLPAARRRGDWRMVDARGRLHAPQCEALEHQGRATYRRIRDGA